MLTANRFDEIKKLIAARRSSPSFTDDAVGEIVQAASELASEIDRTRQPAQVGGRSHIRPVIFDAQGNAVAPPPLLHQFAAERREQYDDDRLDAISDPIDINRWRVFCLRWGLSPPPGGWENTEVITNVIHAVRLGVRRVPHLAKHASAIHLKGKGLALPPGVTLVDGELRGTESLS